MQMHKSSTVSILVLLMLLSTTFIHMSSATNISYYQSKGTDLSEWINWARDAWSYYDPGTGVDPNTGILRASYHWAFLTDWDLGGYIIAIIKAELMGILPKDGEWGADDRIEKVLRFLETRQISPYGIPYHIYRSSGEPSGKAVTNVSDSGRLLIALAMLKKYRPDLAGRIDAIVRRNNYELLANRTDAWRTTAGFYKYYVAQGFKLFGLDKSWPVQMALKEFDNIMNGPHVDVYGVSLPKTEVTSEPLLHMVFELDVDGKYLDDVKRVYEAQERRYRSTGKYTAWSEGNTGLQDITYVYQWIVTPGGETWKITPKDVTPIIFTKAAFGFHALYNTDYTRQLVDYLVRKNEERKNTLPYLLFLPRKGFIEGVDENGRIVADLVDKTQVIIIESAYYALKKKALEAADVTFGTSSTNIMPGEAVQLKFTYLDPTPLKHTCRYNVTINGLTTSYTIQYSFDTTCNITLNWTPPRDDLYRITVRTVANYVLFNKTIIKSFDIQAGTVSIVREARIVGINHPSQVNPNEEFNIDASVWYNFSKESTPLTVIVKDKITGRIMAQANPVNVTNEGTTTFMITIKAPDKEGILSLILTPAYHDGDNWVGLDNAATDIEILIIGSQQTQGTVVKTIIRKEVTHVTVTRSITVDQWKTTTHTITETHIEHSATSNLMPIAVIICSLCLLIIAILVLVASRRKPSWPEYYQYEDVGW